MYSANNVSKSWKMLHQLACNGIRDMQANLTKTNLINQEHQWEEWRREKIMLLPKEMLAKIHHMIRAFGFVNFPAWQTVKNTRI
jgi:hypothetical protein